MKKHTQLYDKENNLISEVKLEVPNFWTLLNKDNMTNALALSLVLLTISLCYSAMKTGISDNPVQIKVGEYGR